MFSDTVISAEKMTGVLRTPRCALRVRQETDNSLATDFNLSCGRVKKKEEGLRRGSRQLTGSLSCSLRQPPPSMIAYLIWKKCVRYRSCDFIAVGRPTRNVWRERKREKDDGVRWLENAPNTSSFWRLLRGCWAEIDF